MAAVSELGKHAAGHDYVLHRLKEITLHDGNAGVRVAAIRETARGWRNHPQTLAWLVTRASGGIDWPVREAAARELLRGWRSHPGMERLLTNIVSALIRHSGN